MIALAVRDNVITKEIANTALPGLHYVKVKYDYKRMLNALPEPPQVIQLREEIYRRSQRAGSLGGWRCSLGGH